MPVELPQWLQDLRRSEIIERVRDDPRSTGDTLLGVSRDVAAREIIGGGQADFDQSWNDLSASDRVLLYAYINQPGHLEELAEAFRRDAKFERVRLLGYDDGVDDRDALRRRAA